MPSRRDVRETEAGFADRLGRSMDQQVKRTEIPGGGGGVVNGAGINGGRREVHGFMIERGKPVAPAVKDMMKKRLRPGR